MEEELLTLNEAADFLKISPGILRQHAHNGVVPARKDGRSWWFSRSELEEWLRSGGSQVAMDVDASSWGK